MNNQTQCIKLVFAAVLNKPVSATGGSVNWTCLADKDNWK